MSLSDIFSRAFFRSPEERKAADLEKLQRKLDWLAEYRLEMMLEDEMDRADARDAHPKPVQVEMTFRNLAPADITESVLAENDSLEFLYCLAEEAEAKLTVEVTAVKSRPFFWQDEKESAPYARFTITIDPNRPYAESSLLLAEARAPSGKTVCGDVKAQP